MRRISILACACLVIAAGVVAVPSMTAGGTTAPSLATALPPASCKEDFSQADLRHYVRDVYWRVKIRKDARRRIRTMVYCQHSRRARKKVRAFLRERRSWRSSVGIWEIRYRNLSPGDKGWLAGVAQCESNGNPKAVGGGGIFRGKYQFLMSTWASVGGSGDPVNAHEREQDMRAIYLRNRSGTSPWPVCG